MTTSYFNYNPNTTTLPLLSDIQDRLNLLLPQGQLSANGWQGDLDQDCHFMALAIQQARQGLYTARPNPCVGAVIVRDNQVIGKGFHPKAGKAHAEVFALEYAKKHHQDTRNATAYVTLEPCNHTGRTPPCTQALINAGIKKVIIANLDPNPQVAGSGVRRLLSAGIEVGIGVLAQEAAALNVGFFKAMDTKTPYVRLKIGVSLDGKIATKTGESKWITNTPSRQDVQHLRAKSSAIITGAGTILADNPRLNVRCINGITDFAKHPIYRHFQTPDIFIMDRQGRIKKAKNLAVMNNPNTTLWQGDIPSLLNALHQAQHNDVLVEAGATLATAFLTKGFVDELIVYQAPCLLGADAQPMFLANIAHLSDKLNFVVASVDKIGNDVKWVLYPK